MARQRSDERRSLTVLWRIENLTYWEPEFLGRRINCKNFTALCLSGGSISMCVFPKGRHEDDPHLQLQLISCFDESINYSIDCEWSLLDDVGSPLFTETFRNQVILYSQLVAMSSGPTHDEVFVARKSSFLPHDTLTVQCRIYKSSGNLEYAEHISALTRIKAAEKSFVWRIEAFSSLQLDEKVTTRVQISHFSDFLLNFSLMGASLEDARVNFQITAEETERLKLTIKLSILKEEKDMKCVEGICALRDGISEQTWDLPKFVSWKEILDKRSDWLCGDALTLRCKFTAVKIRTDDLIESSYCGPTHLKTNIPRHNPGVIKNDRTVSKQIKLNPRKDVSTIVEASCRTTHQSGDQSDISQRKSNSAAVLLDDLRALYTDHTLFDFELRSGDVSFPVHKNVLSARSPVFRAMFCGDMREADSTSLDVPDVDAHTLNRMLTFLYTGIVDDLQWEGAAKLYYSADKYQVLSLKQECSSLLRSCISVLNVCDILALADRHQDDDLMSFVHDFILGHYDEVVLSEEWDTFLDSDPHFAGKTLKKIYKKKVQLEN